MTDRVLLLVDDEENILSALRRVFRRDGYQILSAGNGEEALQHCYQQEIGVILSDQRMPGMTGTEFLKKAREVRPDAVRMVLSGYTDFNTVTNAINEGDIFKFLVKPWDDDALRETVRAAFEHYGVVTENRRLSSELQLANDALSAINQDLEKMVEEKTKEVIRNWRILQVSQEMLAQLPVGVIGIDADDMVVSANQIVYHWLDVVVEDFIGEAVNDVLPPVMLAFYLKAKAGGGAVGEITLSDKSDLIVHCVKLGLSSGAQGTMLVLVRI